jgi:hypothetical protein
VVEGTAGGHTPPPVRGRDALPQAPVGLPGRVGPPRTGRRGSRLPGAGGGHRLRTAQLGTSPCATMSLGSGGAERPGSRLTA